MTTYYQSQQNTLNDSIAPLYEQYLQNQHQWISSLFTMTTSSLETNIMAKILSTINEDKTKKENIMMISMCQLMEKVHCNGTLLQNILSNEIDEKQQNNSNQTNEYLNQILQILNTQQNSKLNAMESKLYHIETEIKSHTNILKNIHNEMKNYNACKHEIKEINKNETDPTQYGKILHKIHQIDKKINIIKSKQIKINQCGEQQIEMMEQLKIEHNQIEEALLSQSISMQSIKSKIHSNAETFMSINSQLKSSNNTYDMTSIQKSLQSIRSELLSCTNNKYDIPKHTSSQNASNQPTQKVEIKFTNASAPSTSPPNPKPQINTIHTMNNASIQASHKTISLQKIKPPDTKSPNNFCKSPNASTIRTTATQTFPICDSSLKSIRKSTTSTTSATASSHASVLSPKKINEEYFSTYTPTTPTLSFTSKQKFLFYYEDYEHDFEEYKHSGCLMMDPLISSNYYQYKIDANVKKLATNPFSTATIIPTKDAIARAIKHKEIGNEWYSKKQFHVALENYQVAHHLDPTNAIYKLNESAATLMLKDYNGTINCCQDALLYARDAKYKFKAYKRMGVVEERRGNINTSIEYYTKAQAEKFDSDLDKKIKIIRDKHMI